MAVVVCRCTSLHKVVIGQHLVRFRCIKCGALYKAKQLDATGKNASALTRNRTKV